jgi:hypothetical protein
VKVAVHRGLQRAFTRPLARGTIGGTWIAAAARARGFRGPHHLHLHPHLARQPHFACILHCLNMSARQRRSLCDDAV